MPKKVILISSIFPYGNKEQFLETEIKYWSKKNMDITLMPISIERKCREIPSNIEINRSLVNKRSMLNRLYHLPSILVNNIFYKELFVCEKKVKIFKEVLNSISKYIIYKKELEKFIIENMDNELVFYTYWHNEVTYALQTLKKKYDIKVLTRTHGYDLYEERRNNKHMPLRRQFLNNIDKIFTITDSAIDYLTSTYGFNRGIIETARLGVDDKNIVSSSSLNNEFHIVSCSYLIEVKRVDKIIEALYLLGEKNKTIQLKWTHIGNGPLYSELKQKVKDKLNKFNNISVDFVGELSNSKVYDFYLNNKVDVFLNVSESEGVPVSIMEAMSCHIPIIAPNVGGIGDMLVNEYNGVLLSEKSTIEEIVKALNRFGFYKDSKVRDNAYNMFLKKYNAKDNYLSFISKIEKL